MLCKRTERIRARELASNKPALYTPGLGVLSVQIKPACKPICAERWARLRLYLCSILKQASCEGGEDYSQQQSFAMPVQSRLTH